MPYTTIGARFDGTDDYLNRASAFVGAAVGKQGMLSVWFRMLADDGVASVLFASTAPIAGTVLLQRTAANQLRLILFNADGVTAAFDVTNTTGTYTADGLWHNYLASWNANTTTIQVRIDGVSTSLTDNVARNNTNIDYVATTWRIAANTALTVFVNVDLDQLYFNQATNLDLATASNLAKFWTNEGNPSGKPVDLGATGANPTGSQPLVYLRGPGDTIATNLGSGGNFTVTGGGLTNSAAPQPSDSSPLAWKIKANQVQCLVAQ